MKFFSSGSAYSRLHFSQMDFEIFNLYLRYDFSKIPFFYLHFFNFKKFFLNLIVEILRNHLTKVEFNNSSFEEKLGEHDNFNHCRETGERRSKNVILQESTFSENFAKRISNKVKRNSQWQQGLQTITQMMESEEE